MYKGHTFHIPVLGIGFSVDTPIKVAHLGIDSVVSLSDDILLERLRKMYCEKFQIEYNEIADKVADFRAKRITAYLDLMNSLVDRKIQEVKDTMVNSYEKVKNYVENLPDTSSIKKEFDDYIENNGSIKELGTWINKLLNKGSVDVNIMTKVDRENYVDGEKLPIEYNDAHAALRGFANSNLESSVILSAGMSPRLYSYITQFDDFYPREDGYIKKKIVLKVSDYRSALIQGQFLAKKGIWISEYRIESGLNCGGHAFATEGHLLGPILEEFKNKKEELVASVFSTLTASLERLERETPKAELPLRVTAQGGVGTSEEHDFLLDYYNVDSVGWGTPFLLVPEATNVDDPTMNKLMEAKEKDLYLSNISPLGVPFNNLRDNTKDEEKVTFMEKGRPGSSCPKKYLALNKSLDDKGLCTASRQFQHLKLVELDLLDLAKDEYDKEYNKITEKSCICTGLGTSVLLNNELDTKREGQGVSVCPGPNMAYFSKKMSLDEMINHIYGKVDVIERSDRPNMFMKELSLYVDYFRKQMDEVTSLITRKKEKQLLAFAENLKGGIQYYQELFTSNTTFFKENLTTVTQQLEVYTSKIDDFVAPLKKEEVV